MAVEATERIPCYLTGRLQFSRELTKMPNKKSKKSTDSKSPYKALLFAIVALSVNFWAWSLISPVATTISEQYKLSAANLSLLLACPVIIGSLGRILLGALTDKYGGRKMFITASLLMILPILGLIFGGSTSTLFVSVVMLGLGGASFAIGVPFVSAWFPPAKRGLAIGLYSMGNAGTAISGFLTPSLAVKFGLAPTYGLVAILLALTAVMFYLFAQDSRSWTPSKHSAIKILVKSLRLRLTKDLSLVYMISFGAYVAFGVYLPVLLKTQHNLALSDAAARAAGFVLVATLARPVGGWFSDKLGAKRIIPTLLLMVSVLSFYIATQPTLALTTTVAYLTLAFTLGCINGAVFALVSRRSPSDLVGGIGGVVGAIGGLGGFFPPLILGVSYQQTQSYAWSFIGLSLSAFAVYLYITVRFRDTTLYPDIK